VRARQRWSGAGCLPVIQLGEEGAATGQRVLDAGSTTVAGEMTTVAVNYRDGTWWRATSAASTGSTPPRCTPGMAIGSGGWPAFIRLELRCGEYVVDGRQWVDGMSAIKIAQRHGLAVLWLNPATYLPVRVITNEPQPIQTVINGPQDHLIGSPQMQRADKACQHLAPVSAPLTPAQQRQVFSQALKFSACMRAHGLPTFPDPVVSAQGVSLSLAGTGIDFNSPQLQSAHQACRKLMPGLPGGGS
jgi:hypothetical protein